MTKGKKRMTQREKDERARIKKKLQADGLLPPDKQRLNRKKFLEEVEKEWAESMSLADVRDAFCTAEAIHIMIGYEGRKPSAELVGVLKMMKLAMELKKFRAVANAEGKIPTMGELFEQVVEPVMKL